MNAEDLPHTITSAVLYRMRIDSFKELPTDKQPARDLWSKPYKLEKFLDEVFERKTEKTEFIDVDQEDVE